MDKFILNANGEPVVEHDITKWGIWFETADRQVAKTVIGEEQVTVSTVFLGIDHNFCETGDPILFETMVFRGAHDTHIERCCTRKEALAQHAEVMAMVRETI